MRKCSYIIKLEVNKKNRLWKNYHTKEEISKMRKQGKEERGITLIALVVSIVVLLILAGVSIATLTGENR